MTASLHGAPQDPDVFVELDEIWRDRLRGSTCGQEDDALHTAFAYPLSSVIVVEHCISTHGSAMKKQFSRARMGIEVTN